MTNHELKQLDSWHASISPLDAQKVALILGISVKTVPNLSGMGNWPASRSQHENAGSHTNRSKNISAPQSTSVHVDKKPPGR